jgi:hypothetical protein
MSTLYQISQKVPQKFVHALQGFDYIGHGVIRQLILATLGPYQTIEVTPVYEPDGVVISGAICKFIFTIDGRDVVVTATGSVDNPYQTKKDGETPVKRNGDILKDCESDALKRAAMTLGFGLELWSQYKGDTEYFLEEWIHTHKAHPKETVIRRIQELVGVAKIGATQKTLNHILDKLFVKYSDKLIFMKRVFGSSDLNDEQVAAICSYFGIDFVDGKAQGSIYPSAVTEAMNVVS